VPPRTRSRRGRRIWPKFDAIQLVGTTIALLQATGAAQIVKRVARALDQSAPSLASRAHELLAEWTSRSGAESV
jgi:hypothetical protein